MEKLGITAELADSAEGHAGTVPGSQSSLRLCLYDDALGAIVAPRVRELLSKAQPHPKPAPQGSAVALGGQWDIEIAYTRDHAVHTLFLEQKGDKVAGSHRGEFLSGDIRGTVEGAKLRCRSSHQEPA
jgi:L-seryl-tRNA(Ser) seleniumtransferase